MPQMYPIMWTLLFLCTLVSILVTSSIIYFSTSNSSYKTLSTHKSPKMSNTNWKW